MFSAFRALPPLGSLSFMALLLASAAALLGLVGQPSLQHTSSRRVAPIGSSVSGCAFRLPVVQTAAVRRCQHVAACEADAAIPPPPPAPPSPLVLDAETKLQLAILLSTSFLVQMGVGMGIIVLPVRAATSAATALPLCAATALPLHCAATMRCHRIVTALRCRYALHMCTCGGPGWVSARYCMRGTACEARPARRCACMPRTGVRAVARPRPARCGATGRAPAGAPEYDAGGPCGGPGGKPHHTVVSTAQRCHATLRR